MKSCSKSILLAAVFILATSPVLALRVGTYQSMMSGSWSNPDVWEMWNGTLWGQAQTAPGPTNDVMILSGDTVKPGAADTCRNLYVMPGGVVTYMLAMDVTILIYGDTVSNQGTIGGPNVRLFLQCMGSVVFTGTTTNVYDVAQVRAGAAGITIRFDDDFKVHRNGLAVCGNGYDNVNYEVGTGDTLELYGSADFCAGTNVNDTASAGGIMGIDGTVLTGSGSKFNISVGNGKVFYLTIGTNGSLSLGDTMVADGPGTGAEIVDVMGTIQKTTSDTLRFHLLYADRAAGLTIGFPVRINSQLTLGNGWLACNSITIADRANIFRTPACSLKTTPTFLGKVNLNYTGSGWVTSGREVPDADSTINDATINSNLILTKNASCYGTLSLGDTVVTGNNILSACGTANLSSGYVNGRLEWSIPTGSVVTRQYFIGTDNGYTPATVTFYNVSEPGRLWFDAEQSTAGYLHHNDRGLKRNWFSFYNDFATFDSAKVSMTYLPIDFNTNFIEATDEATMLVGQYSGSDWTYPRIVSRTPGGSANGGVIDVMVNYLHCSTLTAGKDTSAFINPVPRISVIRPASTYDTLGPYTVRAVISDPGKSISTDTLYYNWCGTKFSMGHSAVSSDTFDYIIPGPFLSGTVVDYYLKSWDDEGAVTFAPESRGVTNGMPLAHYTLKILKALPPSNLEAVGGDHAVSLTWNAPQDMLRYTECLSANLDALHAGDFVVTRFTPMHSPCFLDSALSLWTDSGPISDSVEVHLWPDDGTGLPDTTANLVTPFKILPVVQFGMTKAYFNKLVPYYCKDFYIGYRILNNYHPWPSIGRSSGHGLRTLLYDGGWSHVYQDEGFWEFYQQVHCTYEYSSKGANYAKGANPDSSCLAQYYIYRGTTPGGPYSQIGYSDATKKNYTDSTAVNGLTYYYAVQSYYTNPIKQSDYSNEATATPSGVASESETPGMPRIFVMQAAYPNPSRGAITIKYQLPKRADVRLQVYNVAGQLVKTFNDGQKPAGYYQINWNGNALANGIYFYQLNAGEFSATKKLVVMK